MKWGIIAAALLSAAPAVAQKPNGWVLLGARTVADRSENDSVVLSGHQMFRQIRLCVQRDPVRVHDLDVHFNNGGHQDITVGKKIPDGGCTADFDLDGGERDVARIDFRYEAAGGGRGRATIRVFGHR